MARHSLPRRAGLLFLTLSLTVGAYLIAPDTPSAPPPEPIPVSSEPVSYQQQVKPILERRCVVCHGCYDAPCQLKLSSLAGLRRGASTQRIYDPTRLGSMTPTRLFIDASTTAQWRQRGFFPVIDETAGNPQAILKNSVLYRLLRLKRQHPLPHNGRLPDDITLSLNRAESCPSNLTIDDFERDTPLWGMPYGMPNLSDKEYRTLVSWLAQGAQGEDAFQPSASARRQIETWERFFNRPQAKQRLVSRYIYEHLFHAHIHFEGSPEREFYRLIRSSTPPGVPAREIATELPIDDPGREDFYYRLVPYLPSIVAKNHIVYSLSDARLRRYRELFLEPDYTVDKLPGYERNAAANPFKTFAAIPARSRYRFMLDDAYFFVQGFIKGPVCRGQIALSVIEDRFWIFFFSPDQPIVTNDEDFLQQMADALQIPPQSENNLDLLHIWTHYWQGQRRYMEKKQAWFKRIGTHDLRHAMNFIWDGEGHNPNAALTVLRHFDSGSVAHGLVGEPPETAWVIDFPLFERIHYLLVAGFNVYGNLGHRLGTRIFMDFLRMEGEDYFLAFLPANHRRAIRERWYAGQRRAVEKLFAAPQAWLEKDAVLGYRSNDPQQELYQQLQRHLTDLQAPAHALNLCGRRQCPDEPTKLAVTRTLQKLARLHGRALQHLPDLTYLYIDDGAAGLSYSLVRDRGYKNVTSFLADADQTTRADLSQDTLTVLPWLEGSYPNFFFRVELAELDEFVRHISTIADAADYEALVVRFGIRRTNPAFWALADHFQDKALQQQPLHGGILDLSRYHNH